MYEVGSSILTKQKQQLTKTSTPQGLLEVVLELSIISHDLL